MKEIIEQVICDQHRAERIMAVKRVEFGVFGTSYGKDLCQECLDRFRAQADEWRHNAEKLRAGEPEATEAAVMAVEIPNPEKGLQGIEWWRTPEGANPRTREAFKEHRRMITEWAMEPKQRKRGVKVNQYGKIPRETGLLWLEEVWQQDASRPGLRVVNSGASS